MAKRLHITLLGHKDHGKSTTIGRLLCDTGSVMEDKVREAKATSDSLGLEFEYAFLLDAFQEERRDGMTIDVIHAQIKGKRYLYDCIDVPGHETLIKNMLTGASHADAGILIASAKEGIGAQTGQHLRLARWLGLGRLIVAINKMDAVGYEQAAFDKMKTGVIEVFGGGHEKISFIPVAAKTGDNIVTRSDKMPWYKGPTLFEAMESIEPHDEVHGEPLRLPVQGVYKRNGGNGLVVGRIESGALRQGDSVSIAPGGTIATVVKIMVGNEPVAEARKGDNVGLVMEPHPADLGRGAVLCPPGQPPTPRSEVTAPVIFLEATPPDVMIECGTAESKGRFEALAETGIGEVGQVRLLLETPLVAEVSHSSLGRMAIKQKGKIVGVAVVT